jgi:hypothetical protein
MIPVRQHCYNPARVTMADLDKHLDPVMVRDQ